MSLLRIDIYSNRETGSNSSSPSLSNLSQTHPTFSRNQLRCRTWTDSRSSLTGFRSGAATRRSTSKHRMSVSNQITWGLSTCKNNMLIRAANAQGYYPPQQPQSYNYPPQTNSPYPPAGSPYQSPQHASGGTHYQAMPPPGGQPKPDYGYSGHGQSPAYPQGGSSYGGTPQPQHPPPGALMPYNGAPYPSGGNAPGPVPPRWVPCWSEHDRQWYYVETTGKSSWAAPANFPPLPAMPGFPGSSSQPGYGAQGGYDQRAPSHAGAGYPPPVPGPPQGTYDPRAPGYPPALAPGQGQDGHKKSSSHTMLAAAGGFATGGVAGYLVHEVLGKSSPPRVV